MSPQAAPSNQANRFKPILRAKAKKKYQNGGASDGLSEVPAALPEKRKVSQRVCVLYNGKYWLRIHCNPQIGILILDFTVYRIYVVTFFR